MVPWGQYSSMSLCSEQPWHLAAELQRAPHRARHDRRSGPGPFTEIKITYRTHGRELRPQSLVSDLPGGCEVSSGAHGEIEGKAQDAAGGTIDYDENRPWNSVWAQAVSDEAFWREEVNEPRSTTPGEVVEGDAKVSGAPSASSGQRETTPAPARMANEKQIRPSNTNRTGRVHNIQDGKYIHNRTEYPICAGYNGGQCPNSTQGIWRTQQWDTAHQCDRCLRAHPSSRCPHANYRRRESWRIQKAARKDVDVVERANAHHTDPRWRMSACKRRRSNYCFPTCRRIQWRDLQLQTARPSASCISTVCHVGQVTAWQCLHNS